MTHRDKAYEDRLANMGSRRRLFQDALDYKNNTADYDTEFTELVTGSLLEENRIDSAVHDDPDYPPRGHGHPRRGR